MELKRRRKDGMEIIEELHLCTLCCKMMNLNKEKYVHSKKEGREYYAHESCVLKGMKS